MAPNHLALYDEALRYAKVGDVYTAVKLLKKVSRLVPDWPESYRALGGVYFDRREWKPAFHYLSKAVSLEVEDRQTWWKLGLSAVGLGRLRTAATVWGKFGFADLKCDRPLGLQLKHGEGYEILWMQPLDPSRGRILSIPHPGNGYNYHDLVLYDRRGQQATTVAGRRRVPVFQYVDTLKASPFRTHSCLLHTGEESLISQLEQLCFDAGLGFEVWSNASRSLQMKPITDAERDAFPEYYSNLQPRAETGTSLVALAAVHPAEVERVLNDWQIITLGHYSDLRDYSQ